MKPLAVGDLPLCSPWPFKLESALEDETDSLVAYFRWEKDRELEQVSLKDVLNRVEVDQGQESACQS